jgi:hypothetical protein
VVGGLALGLPLELGGDLGEGVEGGVDAHEGELALDHGQVGSPDVGEDAPQVAGGVVPALARRTRSVGASAHRGEHNGLAGEQRPRLPTRVGDHEVDPRLEVLGDPEVVERHGEQHRVGVEQLVDQPSG